MFYNKTYKGVNKDSVLLGNISDLAGNTDYSPETRLNQIEKCIEGYWKKVLVRKVLDAFFGRGNGVIPL